MAVTAERLKEFNRYRRRAERLKEVDLPRLIRLETVSEAERLELGKDAERAMAFNREVENWANRVRNQLRATVASRSLRVARELRPRVYKGRYGLANRIGFSFPRHGIYIHKGAGRGQGGWSGSKWYKLKTVNGVEVQTSVLRHTNPASLNKMNSGNRKAYPWFDSVIRNRIGELEQIVLKYFDTMVVDATSIYIDK